MFIKCINNLVEHRFAMFNNLLCNRRFNAFWRSVTSSLKCTVSSVKLDSFAYYKSNKMTEDQSKVKQAVESWKS